MWSGACLAQAAKLSLSINIRIPSVVSPSTCHPRASDNPHTIQVVDGSAINAVAAGMSTIASPRDPSTPLARRMNSSQPVTVTTPTSSTRPSLDLPASASGSPNHNAAAGSGSTAAPPNKRATRAALREYYNIRKAAATGASSSGPGTPTVEVTDAPFDGVFGGAAGAGATGGSGDMMTATSELDSAGFDAAAWVARTLQTSSLTELLRAYARVLGEMRALDAEKKALVYDNYSKLISATETIRRMRSTMDPLNPMASTLDLVVAKIYEQANGMREEMRREVQRPLRDSFQQEERNSSERTGEEEGEGGEQDTKRQQIAAVERRRRTRELVLGVLEVPERVRRLVQEGREHEAKREWELPRQLLERWREKGLGGDDVVALLEEGDAALSGRVSLEQNSAASTA
ncbi:Vps51/Vps67-domain-containing protein [Lasiosphaeria miniovina]|uniref:Vacuolar protein sorting-associated protein 51 homolog n=1 Tax=Lasiosphaeria miniovina TaxID=1954250 RepID=A0AA40ACB0_9PEZI|nr:Vps51/Vps67-domain-containing protein [Lasiosphaeria miniovina]KAK0713068.1 Vps51/Vps67-domain-containing protein [Lasiosphaeria miniovina]